MLLYTMCEKQNTKIDELVNHYFVKVVNFFDLVFYVKSSEITHSKVLCYLDHFPCLSDHLKYKFGPASD